MADFDQLDSGSQTRLLQALAHRALLQWRIEAREIALIKFRENAVFRVVDTNGCPYALRIHRHGYHSDDALRSELQWMTALGQSGIPVPEIIPTRNGALFTHTTHPDVPGERQVDLFAWISGRTLGSAGEQLTPEQPVAQLYQTIGQLAARVHNQAVDWRLPAGFTRHAWNAEALAGPEPLWGRFWELPSLSHSQRKLLLEAKAQVHIDLSAYGADAANRNRYSLIHADFVADNLMLDGDQVRLIDFDDAGFGWHLFELATALYFERGEDHFEQAYAGLISGYREFRELPEDQLAWMPLFFAARGFTYLGWVTTRPETETARTLTPTLIDMACSATEDYLNS